jgi:WD40 repeat protein
VQSNLKLAWEKRDIAPMCVSFPASSDTTTFVAGCEDGGLYECHMHGRTPGPAAVIAAHNGSLPLPLFPTHSSAQRFDVACTGPVTSVQHNPWLPLLLSSGMDWTVKLWYTSQHARTIQATKPVDGAESVPTGSQQQQSPLVVLESTSAALFDAQWCPTHVSVFAVGDGVGNIDVWNLLTDADVSPSRGMDRLSPFFTRLIVVLIV